ncbi:terminase small subunit [Bradyrhizobium roseum]|uniref:terminase small subunit n=1 Tax=Bradyrhizobium roseum TaxID=3056648 RepID=UPI002630825F|nr:terminase small subunit [Bradyrhizobium roseus]WKA31595.1 terminase small subunit [Bradyrhizobium roseus]
MPKAAKNAADFAEKPLKNAKHEAVLQAYIADPKRIGFKSYLVVYPNSSDAAASTGFSRLLKNAGFAARLSFLDARVTEKVVEQAAVTREQVIEELAKIGFANMLDYARVTDDGEPYIDLSGVTRDKAAAIASFTVEDFKDGRGEDARDVRKVTFKLHDKRAALVDIGRHLGMFEEKHKHEHTGKDGAALVPVININGQKRSGA